MVELSAHVTEASDMELARTRERDFLRRNPDLVQPPVRLTDAETALLKDWA